jgi:quercetin dioxygenase-like cupin family protein
LFSTSLLAQAPEPVPLASGNMPGEPHHHLKIENEYVRVYYVEVPPHQNTQLHQHDHDYLFVTLGDSDVINAVRDKPEVHLILKDGETHFTRGGFAHVARNLANTPFRNVTIELLKPQGEPHNICERVIEGPVKDCGSSGPSTVPVDSPLRALVRATGPKQLFETEEILVSSHSPPAPIEQHYSESSPHSVRLLVVEDGSELRVDLAGESSKSLHSGEVLWLESEKKWTIVTPGEHKVTRFLLVRFKESESTTKP